MNNIQSLTAVLIASSAVVVAAAAAEKKAPAKAKKEPEPKKKWLTEAEALAVLNSNAELHEKAVALQDLAPFATAKSVPALTALLGHEQLSDYARSGLEIVPDPSAGAALRQALGKLQGRQLAGVVNSLGVRRDTASVPELQKLALDPKRGVASEAIASLGMIGSPAAADTLKKIVTSGPANLRTDAAHAALVAAEQLAKAKNVPAGKALLDAVAKALPAGHLRTAAETQAANLGGSGRRAAAR